MCLPTVPFADATLALHEEDLVVRDCCPSNIHLLINSTQSNKSFVFWDAVRGIVWKRLRMWCLFTLRVCLWRL